MRRLLRLSPPLLAILLVVLALEGCGSVSSHSMMYAAVPRYPASNPEKIEILQHEPARRHQRLGEVFVDTSEDPMQSRVDSTLREEAARLVADAVFLVVDRSRVTSYVTVDPFWGRRVPR